MAKLPRTSRLGFGAAALVVTACGSSSGGGATNGDTPDASLANDAAPAHDAAANDAGPDVEDASANPDGDASSLPTQTAGGVPLPAGWTLHIEDLFGTAPTQNVQTMGELHAKYYEGQQYNRDANGLVDIPNVVINGEQETYVHFETAMVFSTDHMTIQGRGQPDGSITSGEIVSIYRARSFCVEGRYQIPSTDKSWPALWWYGDAQGHDASEIDIEQPITPNQGVHDVSLNNHPTQGTVDILDTHFTTAYMTWTNSSFDASTAPHTYTACYDDSVGEMKRYIDALPIYDAAWTWNATLGGTGNGPDAATIFNLAVGGNWPGNVADPASYSADLDLYSLRYYGP
jgi:hypothetical protein